MLHVTNFLRAFLMRVSTRFLVYIKQVKTKKSSSLKIVYVVTDIMWQEIDKRQIFLFSPLVSLTVWYKVRMTLACTDSLCYLHCHVDLAFSWKYSRSTKWFIIGVN